MIVSAAVIVAIVGGSLAFKDPNNKVFQCQTQPDATKLCKFIVSDVTLTGSTTLSPAVITTENLQDQRCDGPTPPCNGSISYDIEIH